MGQYTQSGRFAIVVLSRYYLAMKKERASRAATLIERVARLTSREAHADGLLPVQWEALRYLSRANRFSRTAVAVTAYLGLTKGTVSQTLKALETKGLIRKQVDPKDRRSNRLALTAKGRRCLAGDPLAETVAALTDLSDSTGLALSRGLEEFLHKRLEAQDRQPFGQCRECVYFAQRHPEGKPHYCRLLKEQLGKLDADAICFEQRPRT